MLDFVQLIINYTFRHTNGNNNSAKNERTTAFGEKYTNDYFDLAC